MSTPGEGGDTARGLAGKGLYRAIVGVVLILFGLGAFFGVNPPTASADVRASDLVLEDYTVEASGGPASLFPNVDANFGLLIDEDGTIFWSRNNAERTWIASITKIMTCMVALEYKGTIPDFTVSEKAAHVGGSTSGLQAGDKISFDDALFALMVPSGNDAAVVLAEGIGATIDPAKVTITESDTAYGQSQGIDIAAQLHSGDPEQVFVALMNLKAHEIGCTDTIFTNPHGLDGGEYGDAMHSTANDVALMGSAAMGDAEFRDLVNDETVMITVRHQDGAVESVELESTDELLGVYEGACGIKTGNAELAGCCFAGACERNGTMLYAIVLDSSSEEQRFADAENLFNWYFKNAIDYPLAHSETTTTMERNGFAEEVPVVAQVAHEGWLDKTFNATFADPDESVAVFAARGNVSQEVTITAPIGNVNVGDVVGHATFYQDNVEIADTDIVACEAVPAPNLFEGVGIWWDRLWRGFSGQETSAPSVIMNETPLIFNKAA